MPEPAATFRLLAQSADISHNKGHSHADLAVLAKLNLELDRTMGAKEETFTVEHGGGLDGTEI
eukprot:gene25368-11030_t